MPTPAKILLAGTSAAILMSAHGLAQETNVLNGQVFIGGTFDANLNVVVEESEDVVGSAVALGNAAAAYSAFGDLNVANDQVLDASGSATSNVSGWSAFIAAASATTFGNALSAEACCGDIAIDSAQRVAPGNTLSSEANVSGGEFGEDTSNNNDGGATAAAMTTANAVSILAGDSNVSGSIGQSNGANASASASIEAILLYGDTASAAQAVGNAITGSVALGSSDLEAEQTNDAGTIAATSSIDGNWGTAVAGGATAAGNSILIQNDWGDASLAANQANTATVSSESVVTLDGFWNASSAATAMGNSTLTSTNGGDSEVTLNQTNFSGGVEAVATLDSIDGSGGGLAVAASAAFGNAATTTVCSDCGGSLSATSSQVNQGPVTATTNMNLGSAGWAAGSAVAVGNSATYTATPGSGG